MRYAKLSLVFVALLTAACAAPQLDELRAQSANAEFQVSAPIECLYERGVAHVSSSLSLSEPKF
ncbi:hypothetical protein ACQV5M_20475, partial [Leptospira sp. SA-E8]|uniref:hypothetical protein n=1 Tax=Leptospira sp. SA-E8 TaxID=3422259 RepID=UPI003EBAEA72